MASHPPQNCCTQGVIHEGTPKGSMIKIGDISTYISHPPTTSTSTTTPKTGILLLTDVMGHKLPNAQLLADAFANSHHLVLMPDLFHADAIDLNALLNGYDWQEWLTRHGPETVDPTITTMIAEMKTKYGYEKIGAVGYCFGAKYVIRHLRPDQIDVGYCAHPSFVDASELAAIKGPLSISAAETDFLFPAEKRHESEKILAETKQVWQLNVFSGVEHGFATRADVSDPVKRFAKESAFLQAVRWFENYLK